MRRNLAQCFGTLLDLVYALSLQNCEEKNPTTSWCAECEEHLCDECVKAHRRVKLTRDHAITAIDATPRKRARRGSSTSSSGAKEAKEVTCQKHGVSEAAAGL